MEYYYKKNIIYKYIHLNRGQNLSTDGYVGRALAPCNRIPFRFRPSETLGNILFFNLL